MRRTLFFVIIIIVTFGCAGGSSGPASIEAHPIDLDPNGQAIVDVGQLRYLGGLELRSHDPQFGGFSSMLLSEDGTRLTMLSDRGRRFEAKLAYSPDGRLTGASLGKGGGTLLPGLASLPRWARDSESMTRLPNGDVLVGFENRPVIGRFAAGFKAALADLPIPDGAADLPANGGLESLTLLPDGRLVVIAEEGEGGQTSLWVGGPGGWDEAAYVLKGYFRPTDAAVLPSGDLLVLERRFTWVGGLAIRLVRVAVSDLRRGARIIGREIARLESPLTVDNFEALAIRPLGPGEVAMYLLSDDNFNRMQRTLLMQFILKDEP